jgi:hypothetical protein
MHAINRKEASQLNRDTTEVEMHEVNEIKLLKGNMLQARRHLAAPSMSLGPDGKVP